MKRAVIGVGSPQGADIAGWLVVERLPQQRGVDTLTLDRPGASLIDVMQGYQQVVLVDAVLTTQEQIVVLDRAELVQHSISALSSHQVGVAEAVRLGDALGLLPQTVYLVGVGVTTEKEKPPSPLLERAACQVLALLGE